MTFCLLHKASSLLESLVTVKRRPLLSVRTSFHFLWTMGQTKIQGEILILEMIETGSQ